MGVAGGTGAGERPPRGLFVLGHPGHELRVWGWLHEWRPAVSVITDGSGSTGQPRLAQTAALLASAGATARAPFGTLSDADIYQGLLAGDHAPVLALAGALAETLLEERIEVVACDALEGYNPTHDLCSLVTGAAVQAAARHGQAVRAYEFAVVGAGHDPAAGSLTHELTGDRLGDKVAAARAYARAAGETLAREVEELLATAGAGAFSHEHLVPLRTGPLEARFAGTRPFFEIHGERRVREGKYREALRLHDHLLPLERALDAWAAAA
jgi:hypothetical protein